MSLFVRLDVGFWTHRKTMRLRAMIGEAALWVPPRLWSYAAQNQPDGDFSQYLPEEIALLVGYSGDAHALLQALQQALFMDGMKVHDWDQHNSYHTVFAERAKKAAAARWKGKEKRGEEKRQALLKERTSNASSINTEDFSMFWQAYPRRVGKASAEKAWIKNGCAKLVPQILTAVRACKISADWTKEGGQFIPYPATWLNRHGWEDELQPLNGCEHPVRASI